MSKNVKVFTSIGIFLGAVLVWSIYLITKNTANQEHIKIYKTTPLPPQQKNEPASVESVRSKPTAEGKVANPTKTPPAVDTHASVEHSAASHDAVGVNTLPDALEMEAPLAETTFETGADVQEWLVAEIERLNAAFHETYPELASLQYMTPQEIREAYPTSEARTALKELVKVAQTEFWADIATVLSKVPPAFLETALEIAGADLAEVWGSEHASLAIRELRSKLRH